MKALSIRQPWAWAILYAGKDIENRDWRSSVRGRVLVHAAKQITLEEWDGALSYMHAISIVRPFPKGLALPLKGDLARGALLGTVDVIDCVVRSSSPWFFGKHGFVVRDPVVFERPIPFKGSLGFFDVPDDVVAGQL